jgi:DNA-binding transcriptional LysR family regulator
MRSVGPDLQADPFCRDGFYLVCRKDHPLSRRRRLTLAALSGEPFIHLAQDSSVRQHIEAAIHPARMNGMMELDQLSTVAGMVRAGLGITVVPALTLFHFDSDDLTALPVETPGLTREVFVIRRRDRSLSIGAQALLAFMMQRRPQPGERRASRRGTALARTRGR